LPSSRTLWGILLLISFGGVFEFYDLFFTAYVAPGMINSGLFTPESLGFFASLKVIQIAGFGTFVFSTFAGLWLGVVVMRGVYRNLPRVTVSFSWDASQMGSIFSGVLPVRALHARISIDVCRQE
jgi:putative MFS transporter